MGIGGDYQSILEREPLRSKYWGLLSYNIEIHCLAKTHSGAVVVLILPLTPYQVDIVLVASSLFLLIDIGNYYDWVITIK